MATVRKPQSATTSPASERSPAVASPTGVATGQDRIAQRAYQIWLESGRPEGHDLEHWLAAERELTSASRSQRR